MIKSVQETNNTKMITSYSVVPYLRRFAPLFCKTATVRTCARDDHFAATYRIPRLFKKFGLDVRGILQVGRRRDSGIVANSLLPACKEKTK